MEQDYIECKVSKTTSILKLILFSVIFILLILSIITTTYKCRGNIFEDIISVVLGIVMVIFFIFLIVETISNINYKFRVFGSGLIEEYDKDVLTNTTKFDKIEGIKRGGSGTYIGNFLLLQNHLGIENIYPIIYGISGKNYLEFIPKFTPNWNNFLDKMNTTIDGLVIDPKLARYVSIDKKRRIFKKIDGFQIFFIIVFLLGFVLGPILFLISHLFRNA